MIKPWFAGLFRTEHPSFSWIYDLNFIDHGLMEKGMSGQINEISCSCDILPVFFNYMYILYIT